jgi:CRISPR-associated protein Csa1
MYFLNEEEKRWLLRGLLPRSRETAVAEELRGWHWHEPPLLPIYDVPLGVFEVAGEYCASARDLYLRRVLGVKAPPNPEMIEGGVLHEAVGRLVLQFKRTIYSTGVDCLTELEKLSILPSLSSFAQASALPPERQFSLEDKLGALWRFEHRRIMARFEDVLAKQPYIGPDALVATALPVTIEQRMSGSFLGLSAHLSADAFLFSEPMLVDLKFGPREPFHRLSTTGYALVLESLHEYPVNVGCVVYVQFKGERVLIERDFHLIDDELRQRFIEARDEKARLVEEEIDPGLAPECRPNCQYHKKCHE